jgi:uncharacterized protein YdgA (DUF945 family)
MRPFCGEHHFRFTASGATFTDADKGIVVVMQPAAGDWMVTGDLDACRGKLSWLGLTAGFGGRMVAVEGLSYAFDLERLDEHIWTGNGAFDLEHLGVRTADGSDFKLKSLHLDSDVREQDGLLNGKGRLSLARLIINELEYGPAGYAAQLHRLDAATVSDFYARQAAMYELLQGASPGEMAEAPGQFGNYLLELLPRLLKRGPALEIADLSFAAPAGVISGSAKLWVDESQPELLEQLATLPYALKADFRLELPRVLLSDSRFEPQVDAMLTAGLLEQRGELVSMHGRFVHGQLMLNDKPLPLVPTVSN